MSGKSKVVCLINLALVESFVVYCTGNYVLLLCLLTLFIKGSTVLISLVQLLFCWMRRGYCIAFGLTSFFNSMQIAKRKIWELVQPHLKTDDACVAALGTHTMRASTGVVVSPSLKDADIS